MDAQIITVILSNLEHLRGKTNASGSSTPCQYFQHMRWDFVVREDLKVFLLEANDSPYFGSFGTPHFTDLCRDIVGKMSSVIIVHLTLD